jgi:hypothetical protein
MKQQRVPVYSASALENSTGEQLGFTIYEIGERVFKISCGKRPPHSFQSKHLIDKERVRGEIETAYNAKDVIVEEYRQ